MNKVIKALSCAGLAALLLTGCGSQAKTGATKKAAAKPAAQTAQAAASAPKGNGKFTVTMTYDYNGERIMASNQLAAWVEDAQGKVVKNLFVTYFTGKGGYTKRKESLPLWVSKANPAKMDAAKLDAITKSTPSTGKQTVVWDGTDDAGKPVAEGKYTMYLEGTLYWSSDFQAHAVIDTTAKGEQNLKVDQKFTEDKKEHRNMIQNVAVSYKSVKSEK